MGDADYLMALELQKQFDKELNSVNDVKISPAEERYYQKKARSEDDDDLNSTCNLVHPEWETLDPTPDVQALFRAFDDKFFQCRLRCVYLEWSKRMYSCAGICYTRRSRLGMAITIRLSEPLLKLRSRKDLIETLLHEMIHAYCSVLGIREGNGGHGPNFRKIMNGINKVTGTNITVYHTFHDEVNVYKTHWWRCNGICQNRKPFYGYVKRTSNRAPGPNDIWWKKHLESCGGNFLKIKEPENKRNKVNKEKQNKFGSDLRKFFPVDSKDSGNAIPVKGPIKSNGGGTLVLNPKISKATAANIPPKTSTPVKSLQPFGNLRNVVGFNDIGSNEKRNKNSETAAACMTGVGYSLTDSINNRENYNKKADSEHRKVDREKLRSIWVQKHSSPGTALQSSNNEKENEDDEACNDPKRRRISQDAKVIACKTGDKQENHWEVVDDEIMVKEDSIPVISISSDEEDEVVMDVIEAPKPKIFQSADEREKQIKKEILDTSEYDISEDDIEIIDGDYDDNLLNASTELADTSLIDDLFGEDTLLKEFKKENAVASYNSSYHSNPRNDIISCPVCQDKITREQFSEHLDGCVGITVRVNPMPSTSKLKKVAPFYKKEPKKKIVTSEASKALKNAGYESDDLEAIINSNESSGAEEDGRRRRVGLDTSTHSCPVCAQEIEIDRINEHLDICLKQ